MANILRPPLIFRTWHKQPWAVAVGSQEWVWQDPMNLKLVGKDTFFRTAGYAPAYDYPNPTLPKDRRVAANTTHEQQSDRLNNLLIKQDRVFGGPGQTHPYDWPNPTWPKPRFVSVASQDWIVSDRNNNLLVKQDIIWGARGMVPDYDWPNPNRLKNERGASTEAQSGVLQNWLLGTLKGQDQIYGGPGQVPDYDWTNPVWPKEWRGTAIRAEDGVLQNWLLGTLQGQDRIYGGPGEVPDYDWTNPVWPKDRGVAVKAQDGVLQNDLGFNLVGQDRIYAGPGKVPTYDWQNPNRVKGERNISLLANDEVQPDQLCGTLLGQDQIYAGPGEVPTYDWQLPPRPKEPWGSALRSQSGAVFNAVLVAFAFGTPHNQTEWPDPTLPLTRQPAIRSQVEVTQNYMPRFFAGTDRYWVNGTGNWSGVNKSNWAALSGGPGGASVPTTSNNVFFDTNSAVSTVTITLATCNNLDFTGFAGTLTGSGATQIAGLICKFVNTMTVSYAGTITFTSNAGTPTAITSAGNILGPVTFNGTGTFQLQDTLNVGANTVTLSRGTYDMNGQDSTQAAFSGTGTNIRGVKFGGNMTLTGTGTVYNCTTTTNLANIYTSGAIKVTDSSATAKTIVGGGGAGARMPNVKKTAGSDTFIITGGCQDLDFTGFSGAFQSNGVSVHGNLTFSSSMTITGAAQLTMSPDSGVTSALTSNGASLTVDLGINAADGTGTVKLGDDLNSTADLFLTKGTLDQNGHAATVLAVYSQNVNIRGLIQGDQNITISGVDVAGTATFAVTTAANFTNTGTGYIKFINNSATTKTFSGAGGTYTNFWNATSGTGVVLISGSNTLSDIKIDAGRTQQFAAGTTTTLSSLTVPNSPTSGITITSDSASPHTLSKASGSVSVYGCTISYSQATGGANWYSWIADGNVDAGNNTGWIFGLGSAGLAQPDWPTPQRGSLPRVALGSQDAVSAGLALSQGAVAPFVQIEWPNPSRAVIWSVALNAEQGSGGRIPPSPPVVSESPWSGFIGNMGRMMVRRG